MSSSPGAFPPPTVTSAAAPPTATVPSTASATSTLPPTSNVGDFGSAPATVIRADHLTKRFGPTLALDDVSFTVGAGITGLIGANGAGKTTMMLIALGLVAPTEGSIDVGVGDASHGLSAGERRQLISFVPERDTLPGESTAVAAVTHLARINGIPAAAAQTTASDALWLVGLADERNRPIRTMSTGQRQRVKLAQALASAPSLVMLDEPTAGLDPGQRSSMLQLVRDIAAEFGISFLLSSHLLEDVKSTCQNVIALDAGRLIAAGSTADVLAEEVSGIRIEFTDALTDGDLAAVGADIGSRLAGADARQIAGADPTLVVRGDASTSYVELADACRDAVAARQLAIRLLAPHQRSLEELYDEHYSGATARPTRTAAP